MINIECIARGVIIEDNKILLCHGIGLSNWFFPGGHIEQGESAPLALVREIMEELGEESEVSDFMGASENKYKRKDEVIHEVNLVYRVKLLTDNGHVSKEDHLEYTWFTEEEFKDMLVYPVSIKEALISSFGEKKEPFWTSEGF